MLAFQKGDEEAFVTLYRRYRDRLVNFCRRFLGSEALGEEAAQEAFLKLHKARQRYAPKSRFSTYLFRIATNHCLNQVARVEHKLTHPDADGAAQPAEPDQEQAAERREVRVALGRALALLPDKQRAALVLCHYEGMSYREAALVLEVTEGAVKSLVHRARERMVRELQPWLESTKVSHAL